MHSARATERESAATMGISTTTFSLASATHLLATLALAATLHFLQTVNPALAAPMARVLTIQARLTALSIALVSVVLWASFVTRPFPMIAKMQLAAMAGTVPTQAIPSMVLFPAHALVALLGFAVTLFCSLIANQPLVGTTGLA